MRKTTKCLSFLIAAVLITGIDIRRIDAGLIQVLPTAEWTAYDQGRDGTFDTVFNGDQYLGIAAGYSGYDAQRIPHNESRGLVEFNLAGLAAGDTILSATLKFAIVGNSRFVDDPNPVTTAKIIGFAGDGIVSLADATVAGPIVASPPDNLFSFGPYSTPIDTNFVQGLVGNSNFLGLRLEINQGIAFTISDRLGVQFGDPGPAPTLVIEFESPRTNQVPEPGGLVLFGLSFAALTCFSCKRRR
jgi:hypothetical protein